MHATVLPPACGGPEYQEFSVSFHLLRRACLGAAIVLGEQPVELFRQHLETLVAALLLVHNLLHLRLPRGLVSVAHTSTPVANAPAEQAKG